MARYSVIEALNINKSNCQFQYHKYFWPSAMHHLSYWVYSPVRPQSLLFFYFKYSLLLSPIAVSVHFRGWIFWEYARVSICLCGITSSQLLFPHTAQLSSFGVLTAVQPVCGEVYWVLGSVLPTSRHTAVSTAFPVCLHGTAETPERLSPAFAGWC